jgi:hypothetical protein
LKFQYVRDKEFFADILSDGDMVAFEKKFKDFFDFRDPKVKRKEFNVIRDRVFNKLIKKYGKKCQLQLSSDCKMSKKFAVDHIIPLSSNQLNKKIRKIKGVLRKKTQTQSFGSNLDKNLTLSCQKCNSLKHNKILPFRKSTNGISFLQGIPTK